jgi:hypothetical protein
MKKKVPADTQMVQLAEDELDIKKKMMDRMETMGNHHRETMKEFTSDLKALNESVTGASFTASTRTNVFPASALFLSTSFPSQPWASLWSWYWESAGSGICFSTCFYVHPHLFL